MQICTYDHLFPDRVENQIHHSTLLTLKDFPSVLSLRPSISGVLTVQISILIWCQHFKHNHLETRPIIFPPPLSGHKKLPTKGHKCQLRKGFIEAGFGAKESETCAHTTYLVSGPAQAYTRGHSWSFTSEGIS